MRSGHISPIRPSRSVYHTHSIMGHTCSEVCIIGFGLSFKWLVQMLQISIQTVENFSCKIEFA
jgi:DNA-binding CsgD family transcriptional regulator